MPDRIDDVTDRLLKFGREWFNEDSEGSRLLREAAWTIERQRERHKETMKTVDLLSQSLDLLCEHYQRKNIEMTAEIDELKEELEYLQRGIASSGPERYL